MGTQASLLRHGKHGRSGLTWPAWTRGRASSLALLMVLALLGGLSTALVTSPAAAASTVGSFEIDGNLADDSGDGEPIDWDTPPPNLTNFTDATGPTDDSFNTGSKELEPGKWDCQVASAPGKDDIVAGQIAFRTVAGEQFVYVDYTRAAVNGDAHIDYEFSQNTAPNPACPALPQRTDGDIVITFDTEQGGKKIFVRAFRWTFAAGSTTVGTFTQLGTGTKGVTFDGAVNIPNTIPGHVAGDFGEAALNLSKTIGNIACGQFATAYMKSRASTSISAALKDRTETRPVNVGECPNSGVVKAVRNVTDGGVFKPSTTADPGETLEYQLTYKNSGTAAASGVTLTDTIQGKQTFVSCSNTCMTNGPPVTSVSWILGTVAPGETVVRTFQVTLDASFPAGTTTIRNVAVVDSNEETPKNSNETTVQVTANPSSTLVKSVRNVTDSGTFAGTAAADPGETLEYQLVYSNTGNAPATGVVVTDVIQAGQTFVSCTAGCTVSGNTVTWTLGTVAAGDSRTLTFQVKLAASFPAGTTTISNIGVTDSDQEPPKNSNTTTVTVTANPVSTAEKAVRNVTDGGVFKPSTTADPGETLEYQLTYKNSGTAAASGVTLTDTIQGKQTFVSCSNTCMTNGPPVTSVSWILGTVAPGETVVRTFQVTLDASFPAGTTTVKNVAVVDSDQEPPKNSNETTVTVTANPSSTLVKSVRNVTDSGTFAGTAAADPGDTVEYQLVYSNTGNAAATNVVVTDVIQPGQTFVSCTGGCAVSGNTVTWTLGTVAAGGSRTLTFQAKLAASFPAGTTTIKNVGVADNDQEPPKTSNETTVTVTASPVSTADKAVRNVTDGGAFAPSTTADPADTLEYRLTYTNSGNAAATGVTLTDTIQAGQTFLSCSNTCMTNGPPITSVSWALGTVAPGDTVVRTFQVMLDSSFPAGTTTVKNVAVVDSDQEPPKNSNETTVTVTANPSSTLVKSVRNVTDSGTFAGTAAADPGDTVEYQLVYSNTGNAAATNVVVTDVIQPGQTFVSCTGGCAVSGNTVTWTLGTVAAGGSRTLTFQAKLAASFPAGTTTIKNVGVADNDQEPPKTSNETTVTVTAKPALALAKAADRTSVDSAGLITYTLTYTNTGNAPATGVVISDTVPSNTAFQSCTGGCTHSAGTVTWPIGTVAAGGSGSVTLTVKVTSLVACEVCNQATIKSPDQNLGAPVSSNRVCVSVVPSDNPSGANANGSATGALAHQSLLGLTLLDATLPAGNDTGHDHTSVDSSQSGVGADSEFTQLIGVSLPGVLQAGVLKTESTSTITSSPAQANAISVATATDVNVLGVVQASLVRGVASATATGSSTTVSSTGSVIEGLKIDLDGSGPLPPVAQAVSPNLRIDLPALVFGSGSYVAIYEDASSTSTPTGSSGGTYAANVTVNMIRVKITGLVLGVAASDVIVSQAVAHADFPQTTVCGAQAKQAVSGSAFILDVQTDPSLLPTTLGYVKIPPSGGSASQTLNTAVVGTLATTKTATSSSTGTLGATSSTATSVAEAAFVCVVETVTGCSVSARAVTSQANSTATAGSRSSNAAGTEFLGLRVLGVAISAPVPPNTVIGLPGIGFVVLNEQTCENGGTLASGCSDGTVPGHTGLTVRAIHVVLLDPAAGGLPGAEVIVAEAHSDAKFLP